MKRIWLSWQEFSSQETPSIIFFFKIRDEVGLNEEDNLPVIRILLQETAFKFLFKIRDEVG